VSEGLSSLGRFAEQAASSLLSSLQSLPAQISSLMGAEASSSGSGGQVGSGSNNVLSSIRAHSLHEPPSRDQLDFDPAFWASGALRTAHSKSAEGQGGGDSSGSCSGGGACEAAFTDRSCTDVSSSSSSRSGSNKGGNFSLGMWLWKEALYSRSS
jgi:hypothetical protein